MELLLGILLIIFVVFNYYWRKAYIKKRDQYIIDVKDLRSQIYGLKLKTKPTHNKIAYNVIVATRNMSSLSDVYNALIDLTETDILVVDKRYLDQIYMAQLDKLRGD